MLEQCLSYKTNARTLFILQNKCLNIVFLSKQMLKHCLSVKTNARTLCFCPREWYTIRFQCECRLRRRCRTAWLPIYFYTIFKVSLICITTAAIHCCKLCSFQVRFSCHDQQYDRCNNVSNGGACRFGMEFLKPLHNRNLC